MNYEFEINQTFRLRSKPSSVIFIKILNKNGDNASKIRSFLELMFFSFFSWMAVLHDTLRI